jgi:hypothetical protein
MDDARLQTTMCSVFLGIRCTEFTVASPPLKGGGGLNVCTQSVVFTSQTFTVPSLEAVITRPPSLVNMASLTYDECPRNSFKVFPDFSPCIRAVPSKDVLRIWVPSLEKETLVTPCPCARSNRRKHCPVRILHTCRFTVLYFHCNYHWE